MIRLFAAVVLVTACATSIGEDAPWETAGPLTSITDATGATEPGLRGAWASRGYGWILEIGSDGMTRYQDGVQCYAAPEETRALSAMAAVEYRYARLLPGGDSAIFQLLDGDTNVVFDRLEGLPERCRAPVDASPGAVAAEFLAAFETHYAFFDRRLPDRAARAERLQAVVHDAMSDADLWSALSSYLDGISDSHTKLIGAVDGERRRQQDGQGATLPRVRDGAGEGPWLSSLIEQTSAGLGDSAVHTLNDRLLWGMLEPEPDRRVGYLQLFVMGGFTDRDDFASDAWATAEMAAFNAALDEAFIAFQGVDQVIVDLSNNRGGWDRVAKALPARFTDTPYVGFTTQTQGSGLAPFPHVIEPAAGPCFTGPVTLLTSDVTVSGGELATLALRQLPNVTHAGTATRGAFSTPLAKPLPNGWLLELSNEVFAAPGGVVFEERGIAPDVALDVYPADAQVDGHWRAVTALSAQRAEAP